MNWHQATFPSLKRRGGCGINKKMRSNQRAADGVVRPAKSSGLCTFAERTTPSARTKVASRCFFDRASTPPFQGWEYARPTIHSHLPMTARSYWNQRNTRGHKTAPTIDFDVLQHPLKRRGM